MFECLAFIWENKLLLCEPKIEFKNRAGGKALETDRRVTSPWHEIDNRPYSFIRWVLQVQSDTKLAIACRVWPVTRRIPY